ncbi:hypothetical protein OIF23_16405 [Streptomyces albidoflavus]|uniref:hypothetical protein n=1 Tax=Streptomyces albidoflavus TaxID=1886 RepID=UPI00387392C7|nr:hypothetical protein OIF23_16405 [Streptomyces albidoflavus]
MNGDGRLDLVVGLPGEDIDGVKDAGSALVLYGAADGSGITTTGSRTSTRTAPASPTRTRRTTSSATRSTSTTSTATAAAT